MESETGQQTSSTGHPRPDLPRLHAPASAFHGMQILDLAKPDNWKAFLQEQGLAERPSPTGSATTPTRYEPSLAYRQNAGVILDQVARLEQQAKPTSQNRQ